MDGVLKGQLEPISKTKRWPRIHLIYFFLAACDILAIGGGLYLSHQLGKVFDWSVQTDLYWDKQLAEVWSLSALIQAANAPPNDVFDSHDPVGEAQKFEVAYSRAGVKIGELKRALTAPQPGIDLKPSLSALAQVEDNLNLVAGEARLVFSNYQAGSLSAAGANMARTDRLTAETNRKLEQSVTAIRTIKEGLHRQHYAQAQTLKQFEYLIGAFILFMVVSAVLYGHSVSRLMRRKYDEIEQASRLLEQSENEAQVAAKTDRLSGLPNRHGFLAHAETDGVAGDAARGAAGVIFADLNGFKEINDTAGHAEGDRIIQAVSARLAATLTGHAFLARIGSDEFAVLLNGDNAIVATPVLAEKISRSFDDAFLLDAAAYHISSAVGYSVSAPERLRSFEQMLHEADVAMYDAKSRHDDRALRYHEGLEIAARSTRELEADLRLALQRGELFVDYQPVVRSADGEMVAAEALVRWRSPSRGMVSPVDFIPVAETSGLIHDVGEFVLRRVCADLCNIPRITVSVNISAIQLKAPAFVEQFTAIVQSYGVDCARIEIELTESVLVENPAVASRRLAALKAAGFRISLDDFGMGYSSLGYLQTLPFDKLKVDRSFISGIGKGNNQNKLLQSLALMCESLDLAVVAEGVESEEQAMLLKLLGYGLLQGWHTGRPMAIGQLCDRIAPSLQAGRVA